MGAVATALASLWHPVSDVPGSWLRRQRRRLDARKELRVAHELFSDFGMEAFAERARVELEATGEHPQTDRRHP